MTKVTWRMPDRYLKELKHIAADDLIPVNTLANNAIKDYLIKRGKKLPKEL